MTKLKRQLSCKVVMFGGSTKPVHAGSKSFINMTLLEGTSGKKNELSRFKSFIIESENRVENNDLWLVIIF